MKKSAIIMLIGVLSLPFGIFFGFLNEVYWKLWSPYIQLLSVSMTWGSPVIVWLVILYKLSVSRHKKRSSFDSDKPEKPL